MIVITKDYRDIDCKFIYFQGEQLCMTLHDDTEVFEELVNISYIKQS